MEKKRIAENDFCDLEPGKICDNCCRCIDTTEPDFDRVLNEMELLAEDYVPDEVSVLNKPLWKPDIDPALLAEWEEKLRILEEQERVEEEEKERRRNGAPFMGIFDNDLEE